MPDLLDRYKGEMLVDLEMKLRHTNKKTVTEDDYDKWLKPTVDKMRKAVDGLGQEALADSYIQHVWRDYKNASIQRVRYRGTRFVRSFLSRELPGDALFGPEGLVMAGFVYHLAGVNGETPLRYVSLLAMAQTELPLAKQAEQDTGLWREGAERLINVIDEHGDAVLADAADYYRWLQK